MLNRCYYSYIVSTDCHISLHRLTDLKPLSVLFSKFMVRYLWMICAVSRLSYTSKWFWFWIFRLHFWRQIPVSVSSTWCRAWTISTSASRTVAVPSSIRKRSSSSVARCRCHVTPERQLVADHTRPRPPSERPPYLCWAVLAAEPETA